MKLTQDSLMVIEQNQQRAFWEKGADILVRLFPEVIEWRKLSYESLLNLVAESYKWTEQQKRPSQLFAVRIACAQLCLGSFFMEDPRHKALQDIVKQQLSLYRLIDDDPIYEYLMTLKSDWSKDAFKEQSSLLNELSTQRDSYIDYQDWIKRLLTNDWRLSIPKVSEEQQALFQILSVQAQNALKRDDEYLVFLLTIAQFYEGINCFNDPLSIRWYRCIVPNAPTLTHDNIVRAYRLAGDYL